MDCREAVAALVSSLELGEPMSDEHREHIRSCERCRSLLESAKEFQTLLEGDGIEPPAVDPTLEVARHEVRRRRRRRAAAIIVAMMVVVSLAALPLYFAFAGRAPAGMLSAMEIAAIAAIVVLAGLVPIAAVLWFARKARRTGRPLHKRLAQGRMLSGVCLGLAERFELNVSLVRLVFIVLLFADGLGFWLYVILDLAMPVHPDDRQHLLRFRLRRWFEKRMSQA
jgi:phage shock protein PspC (stress-responsive transcriptional regulator)